MTPGWTGAPGRNDGGPVGGDRGVEHPAGNWDWRLPGEKIARCEGGVVVIGH